MSERLIGEVLDPAELLADLRFHPGRDPYHGVPGGPGSGLSVRIVEIG